MIFILADYSAIGTSYFMGNGEGVKEMGGIGRVWWYSEGWGVVIGDRLPRILEY